jgi:putative flippase GtrA
MSTHTATPFAGAARRGSDHFHHAALRSFYLLMFLIIAGVGIYGESYYRMGEAQRPFSPKYILLRPSGSIGLWLGLLGAFMFLIIFIYPIRKRWTWLRSKGNTRHWLDFHVMVGLSAPFIIALHASFKFRGIAGMAFWIMSAVALSGVIGRYLYAQIPRSLNAAELSLQEVQEEQTQLAEQLTTQRLFSLSHLEPLFRFPGERYVESLPMVVALIMMILIDALRVLRIARLRLRVLNLWGCLLTLGGLLPSGDPEIERVIVMARKQAALSKRILFLERSQQVFHLWHVVHKPFSYSFALLAVLHIVVVMLFGVR